MRGAFITFALIFITPVSALAANDLTEAEQTVCRSLTHCLSILDNHPYDSFDYKVLAEEFGQYGRKGELALIKRLTIQNGKPEHAADLLAIMATSNSLDQLRSVSRKVPRPQRRLINRTYKAITARLKGHQKNEPPISVSMPPDTSNSGCSHGKDLRFSARKREMPFFELDVATPDLFGAYRPSARHDLPLTLASRGWLQSALPLAGGWLAAYPDGLVQYDNQTGTPQIIIRGRILSLQPQKDYSLSGDVWAFMPTKDGQTYILTISQNSVKLITTLPSSLSELRRDKDHRIYVTGQNGDSVTLMPDASFWPGCRRAVP